MALSDWINSQVVQSVARFATDKIGMLVIGHGWLTGNEYEQVAGIVVSLVVVSFSIVSARTKHVAIEMAGGKTAVKAAVNNPTGL